MRSSRRCGDRSACTLRATRCRDAAPQCGQAAWRCTRIDMLSPPVDVLAEPGPHRGVALLQLDAPLLAARGGLVVGRVDLREPLGRGAELVERHLPLPGRVFVAVPAA